MTRQAVQVRDGYRRTLPSSNEETRRALYAGDLFHLSATPASQVLVGDVRSLLEAQLGAGDPRFAAERLGERAFFEAIGRIRKQLYVDAHFHQRVFDVAAACGFDPDAIAFDPVRLRVVDHLGHENPRAAPIYYPHRDTWFALSQSVVAWWIAVHDIPEEETFDVYPDWLERPVPNDSEGFDYDRWRRDHRDLKIGWQDVDAGAIVHYSGTTEAFEPGRVVPLTAERADNVLFSGAHLHQTRKHAAGHTRYSLDFRVVQITDHEKGVGPINTDNRSRGDATHDYVRR